jgi:cephalosporin hydroxylase
MRLYQRFVRLGSYLIVLDTIIDDMPPEFSQGKPWAPGRGPKAAVREFLRETDRFTIDKEYNDKLLVSVAPDGFLRCVRNP